MGARLGHHRLYWREWRKDGDAAAYGDVAIDGDATTGGDTAAYADDAIDGDITTTDENTTDLEAIGEEIMLFTPFTLTTPDDRRIPKNLRLDRAAPYRPYVIFSKISWIFRG
ncbi:MAG: hypothetical protein LBS11_03765 [Oscillospiraceae bacterium]|jgi:hypothetical protein|nr:hypothetical protein [Oscillospiraceae bacterium]